MYTIIAVLASTLLCTASAQTATVYNAQKVFDQAAQLYSRVDSLNPTKGTLYDLSVPANYSTPDLLLTLNSTSGGTGLGLYCGRRSTQPTSGYALWASDLSTTVNQIYISKNDIYYSQILQRITNTPSLTCSVINADQNETNSFTFTMSVISNNKTLVADDQVRLANLYSRCCAQAGSCNAWKALSNVQFASATPGTGGMIRTDFCSFPGQICTPSASLYRLDLSGFNMSCAWPNDIFSQFSQLTTLLIPGNSFTGNTTALGQTFNALKSLQFFDATGVSGMTGVFDSGDAQTGLCNSAQRSLISLSFSRMNMNGSIPSCLYSGASNLMILSLDQNNFSGTLRDTIPANSSLQGIDLGTNKLSGQLPASLGNAKRLLYMDLSENQFSGSIPSSLGSIRPLYSFSVRLNQLTGPIPDSFGTANNLQLFDAKQNQLTALPAAWSNPDFNATNSSWINIRASMNKISGSFPAGLAYAPALQYLILNENNLTGTLPAKDGMFRSLRAFNVSTNRLTGGIPVQFNQSALFSPNALVVTGQPLQQVFDVSNNRLSGILPDFMAKGKLPSWVSSGLYLQGNNFNVSCLDGSYNYITSICPQGAQSSGNQQYPPSPPPPGTRGSTPANSATSVTASNGRQPQRHHHGLSGGAIAGIVVGSVVGAALVAALIGFIVYRYRSSSAPLGELGRSISLNRGLTSKSSTGSALGDAGIGKFEAFVDAEGQKSIELSPSKELPK